MNELDELIKYLEDKYTIVPADLAEEEFDRGALVGQHNLIQEIKEIAERGYPDEEER